MTSKIEPTGPAPEWLEKRLKITFKHGLPLGVRAEFVHEGMPWIAYPAEKSRRIQSILDQLISFHERIYSDLLGIINDHPEDSARVSYILKKCLRAKEIRDELIDEKIKAVTS